MKSKKPLEFMYFRKDHLRNALRTFKRYACITIIEDYANSLGGEYTNKWKGKLLDIKGFGRFHPLGWNSKKPKVFNFQATN